MSHKISDDDQNERIVYSVELPIYGSLKEMAGATGIPYSLLKHAKNNGCKFTTTSGKARLGDFLKWFFTQDDTGIDWDVRLKKAKALTVEVDLEETRRRLIAFASVKRYIDDLVSNCFIGEFERVKDEYPGLLKGKSELAIAKEVGRQMELAIAKLRKKLFELDSMGPQSKEAA